jgi:plasmid stabilization system protein ParE
MGRSRDELVPGIRSFPFRNHIIFFRYTPSNSNRVYFEAVNILRGSMDFHAFFDEDGE